MGGLSIYHWLIVALVVLVLFGRGKISETMGDFGKGVRSFRKGMAEADDVKPSTPVPPAAQLPPQQPAVQPEVAPAPEKKPDEAA